VKKRLARRIPGARPHAPGQPARRLLGALALAGLLLAGCGKDRSGPIAVSAIGGPPVVGNPNAQPLDPPAAFLAQTTAQGLVRFEASGQIEPALAQRWIVSDDGLRYTFRMADVQWSRGGKVTAAQVAARLRAAAGPTSRNRLRPLLGVIDEIEPMTEDVLEISLKAPRPNFLDLLAQPEMAILRNGEGSGPYRAARRPGGSILLTPPAPDEDAGNDPAPPQILLRGERAGLAVARFESGEADLVTGGTLGDLPVARAVDKAAAALRFDPVGGLLGLSILRGDGPLATPAVRDALGMAIDRAALVAALAVPGLQPRESLVPAGIQEYPSPAVPAWSARPLPARRAAAAQIVARAAKGAPLRLRVIVPAGPGYRILFAYLRGDWRAIGVEAEAVPEGADADLRIIDVVAPVGMASWYLRSFSCEASRVCSPDADRAMEAARIAQTPAERRDLLGKADLLLATSVPFIPLAAPVRWSLVSRRLTGFQPNVFAQHAASELIAARQ